MRWRSIKLSHISSSSVKYACFRHYNNDKYYKKPLMKVLSIKTIYKKRNGNKETFSHKSITPGSCRMRQEKPRYPCFFFF